MSTQKKHLDQLRIDRSEPERKRIGAWFIWGGIALVLGLGALAVRHFIQPSAISVTTATVRESAEGAPATVLNASGYVTARREATVSSKVTGKVSEVLVEEGMKVEEGQVLARLDSSNVTANFNLAEAQLAAAKAAIGETKIRLAESERNWNRISTLASDEIASTADLDSAEAELKALQARLEREVVNISVAERQLALWQQRLEDNVIRAPFTGIVVSKNAQPGEMISPVSAGGGFTRTGICTIVDMDSLEIEVDVSESYINRVDSGQNVVAVLDAYPDWQIPAGVIAIIPTADRQKATVKVRVGFRKLDSRILPQMGVKVSFQDSAKVGDIRRRVTIPKNAVRRHEGRDIVMVVKGQRAERRAVTVGDASAEGLEVLSGLAGGEKVIISPPVGLTDGADVKELKR